MASVQSAMRSGWLFGEPGGAERAAGLLVRGEDEPDRTPGRAARAHPLADHRQQDRVEVLHVHRAAAPDVAVDDLAGERVDLPVGRDRRHHVGVAVDQQRRQRGVAALGCPVGDQSGAARLGLEQLAGDADLVELRGDVLGRLPLALGARRAEVGGVEADQVAAQSCDLVVAAGSEVMGPSCHRARPADRPFRQPRRRLGIVLWLSGAPGQHPVRVAE